MRQLSALWNGLGLDGDWCMRDTLTEFSLRTVPKRTLSALFLVFYQRLDHIIVSSFVKISKKLYQIFVCQWYFMILLWITIIIKLKQKDHVDFFSFSGKCILALQLNPVVASLQLKAVNLLVSIPGVSDNNPPTDATTTIPTRDDEGETMDTTSPTAVVYTKANKPSEVVLPVQNKATSVPCSIILHDVSVKLKWKTSVVFSPTEEEMCKAKVCLEQIDQSKRDLPRLRGRKRQRPQSRQPSR